ncbi:MAG TPA: hypothetical protein VM490_07975 [Armatimonadaceae bacterium]|nr:hypothetical protein [Armatimonadaceae bacterium]
MAEDETIQSENLTGGVPESVNDSAPADAPAAAQQRQERPPAKIEPGDAFTLISRTIASLLLTSLAVYYGYTGNYAVMIPLALVGLLVQYATIRLIRRIREQNKEFIAWRAAQEEAERQRRKAEKAAKKPSSRGAVRP